MDCIKFISNEFSSVVQMRRKNYTFVLCTYVFFSWSEIHKLQFMLIIVILITISRSHLYWSYVTMVMGVLTIILIITYATLLIFTCIVICTSYLLHMSGGILIIMSHQCTYSCTGFSYKSAILTRYKVTGYQRDELVLLPY